MSILDLRMRSRYPWRAVTAPAGAPDFFSSQIAAAQRFCLDLNPSPDERLVVVCGGYEQCAPDYEICRPSFPYWVIELVAQGKGYVTLHDHRYPLVPGTVFAYGPGISQHIVPDPSAQMVKYFVVFAGRDVLALLRQYEPQPGHAVQTLAPSDVLAVFDDLVRAGLRASPFTPRLTELLLEQLMVRLAETAMPVGMPNSRPFATYSRCRAYIEDHWRETATLHEAARQCDVSVAYFCRLFQRFDHQSPYQFLMRLKMGEAAARLLADTVSVGRVAEDLGFSDAFHFSRVFKKVVGVSPGRFARTHHRSRRAR
jgi:AraC-like DNA-binding protein